MIMNQNIVNFYIAGGDDCRFHTYDMRIGAEHPVSSSRAHEAGVTSLHSNALFEHLLASGRYVTAGKFHISEFLVTGYLQSLFVAGFRGGKMGGNFDY